MDDRPRTIRFCVNNPRSLEERQLLLNAECDLRDCLGRCSACFDERFVMVGREVIEGPDFPSIIARARALARTCRMNSQPADAHARQ